MFYTENGVSIGQLGTGDALVTGGLIDDPSETIGCLSLCDQHESHPIGSEWKSDECILDTDLDPKIRIIFTDIRSIDVVIDRLEKIKLMMAKDDEVC